MTGVFEEQKKDLRNRKKTSMAAGTRERGRGNAEVEVMKRHELKQA